MEQNEINNEVQNEQTPEISVLEVQSSIPDMDVQSNDTIDVVPPEENKVERRGGKRTGAGRKKKVHTENNDVANSDVSEQLSKSPEEELKEISSEINNKLEYQKDDSGEIVHEEQKREYAVLISGYVLLTILNAIMPSLLVTLLGRFIPKVKKVNPKNIALDKDEIEMLQPSADELVKSIFSTMSPVNQFFFAYTIITAGKLMLEIQSVNE